MTNKNFLEFHFVANDIQPTFMKRKSNVSKLILVEITGINVVNIFSYN